MYLKPPELAEMHLAGSEGGFVAFKRPIIVATMMHCSSSIGHPPHSSASPVELRLRVGPRALSEKKIT